DRTGALIARMDGGNQLPAAQHLDHLPPRFEFIWQRTTEHDFRLAAGSVFTQPLAPCIVSSSRENFRYGEATQDARETARDKAPPLGTLGGFAAVAPSAYRDPPCLRPDRT